MKVNFLLPHFGIKPTGGFKIVYEYANYLADRGFDITIIHGHFLNNIKQRIVVCSKDYIKLMLSKKTWININKNIKLIYVPKLKEKYIPDADITIATACQTADVLGKVSYKKGKKLYLIQHYETWNGSKSEVDSTWKNKDIHKIMISKWLLDIAKDMNIPNNEVTYIPNALDHNKFKVINSIENRDKIISMMYSDVDWKGSKDGIKAIEKLKIIHPEIKVRFFGKCKRDNNIPEWIEYFENPKQNVLVEEIYNKASIFLCPSWFEGWGLPPMEAMACGCAVVTTENGGVNDFAIADKTALVCKPKDIEAMEFLLQKLVEDDSLRVDLAENGVEYVKNFTWEKSFKKFEELLLSMK